MDLYIVKEWLEENLILFVLLGILLLPTLFHFMLISAGANSPYFIKTLAINNWMKAIVGLGLGVFFGFMVNKKFGD